MRQLILIDGNILGFAGMSNPRLSTGDKDTQSTFTFLKRIRHIVADNPDALIMVLWDGRSWRKDVYPEYKANREATEKQVRDRDSYVDQKKDIIEGLKCLGVRQASADNMEADDLAEIFSRKWKGDQVMLLTGDKDWLQLIDARTKWIDPINVRECSIRNFEEFTGYPDTETFTEAKCVLGDSGDNVKGIHGIGEKTLEKIYKIAPSFVDFLMFTDQIIEDDWLATHGKKAPKIVRELDRVAAARKLKENHTLMNLRTEHRPEPINLSIKPGFLNQDKFAELCGRLAFLSFLKDLDKFLLPFKENQYVSK